MLLEEHLPVEKRKMWNDAVTTDSRVMKPSRIFGGFGKISSNRSEGQIILKKAAKPYPCLREPNVEEFRFKNSQGELELLEIHDSQRF